MLTQLRQDRTHPAKTSLGKSASAYSLGDVYVDPEIIAVRQMLRVASEATLQNRSSTNLQAGTIYIHGSYVKSTQIRYWSDVDVTTAFYPLVTQTDAKESIRALSERLCEEHPAISTYEGIFGGVPHLNGLRIAVADILEQLYLTGSIAAVQRVYSPDVSEDQIKEAIAYAQDFLESAISSPSEVNG